MPSSKKMIAIWRRASDLILYGDYYPHTPFHRSADKWVAWQFDCPEKGHGFVQGIRLPASAKGTFTIHPKGIDPSSNVPHWKMLKLVKHWKSRDAT